MLNSETIERLLNVEGPAVTIYCPLQPEQRDTRAVEAGCRELVGQANAMLEQDGIELRRRDALLDPVRELGIDFTRHRDPTLVVFRSQNLMIAEPVPRELPAFMSVGMDFNIKPLLPLLSANRRLFILALSRSQARLLVATRSPARKCRCRRCPQMRRPNSTASLSGRASPPNPRPMPNGRH